nr:glycosyltransferase [Desulfobulbus alkaliphilus]
MCLQSTIEAKDAEELRKISPEIKIIYWWGPPVDQEDQIPRLLELASFVDILALTHKGDCEHLRAQGATDAIHLPFAACPYAHRVQLTPRIQKKWGRDVVLVAPHDAYLENLVCKTSEAIQQPVDVWGSGWTSSRWVKFNGQVHPPKTQYIYAASTIVLNLYRAAGTKHNGLNAACYEIAAAGGFQITEEQPVLAGQPLNRHLATYNGVKELGKKTRYYLEEAGARESMRTKLQKHVLEQETYGHRMFALLKSMGYS